jgi:hypothetical protein
MFEHFRSQGRGFCRARWAVLPLAWLAAQSAMATPNSALTFDKANYTSINVTIDGTTVPVRWYKEICYVAKPVEMAATQTKFGRETTISNTACGYQSMNVFVPESAANDQSTAIYFAVNNAGWMGSYITASVTDGATLTSSSSNVGAALKAGYVYIDVATRGRGITAADGSAGGKAPSVVVDAKAAVRYLRLNDAVMPGSAERIVINGTSGGGGLVSILGASGNSADYIPYLAEIGAAGIDNGRRSTLRDDVFAVNAYCPISDLGQADLAYEWLYTKLGTRTTVGTNPDATGSAELAAKFPAYQRSLNLHNMSGRALTADNMLEAIKYEVKRSAETYLAASSSNSIPALGSTFTLSGKTYTNDWIDVDTSTRKVVSIDMTRYLAFVATQATLKGTPAFDQVGLSTSAGGGESNLFGTSSQTYSNFTEFAWNHNDTSSDGIGYDDTGYTWAQFIKLPSTIVDDQVRLIDPLRYIGTSADTAPNWYIRHGTRDRDTAFTVSVNLSRALAADNKLKSLNYRLAWDQPHAGNYDVPEAMQWIADVLAAAKNRGGR